MKKNVLLVGYGSIGRRHARNLMKLGIRPYILTSHPDGLDAIFLKGINSLKGKDFEYCIIASPTAQHLEDLKKCLPYFKNLKRVLIEKPIESSYTKGRLITGIARKYNTQIYVAYNLRFLKVFENISEFIKKQKNRIKIVEAVAGQDLNEWRPQRGVRQSYSAHRKLGGGVDLDLSHEIDYILWLFGNKFKSKCIYRAKISNLDIDSPDIFKMMLGYKKFVADITLDYIRSPKERYIKIICDNGNNLYYDFAKAKADFNNSYTKMLKAFLGIDRKGATKLCSIEEGLNVLKVLEV